MVPIKDAPLGAWILTKNPRPWDYDDSLPEPDEETWGKISLTMHRTDGGIVDAEILRPRAWIEYHGIVAGKLLPMHIEELQVRGSVLVTAIEESPEIADGEGSVVTARFLTREVHEIARVEILGPDGQRDRIEGTSIHPIWSEDRQDWIPLGELRPGETLRAAIGDAIVQTVELLSQTVPVYNIEVHGEHVYEVGELGLVVHNTYAQLATHFRQLEKYGAAGFKELQNGRIRYYGELTLASKPGEMMGRRVVREWDSASGAIRTWLETLDHAGRTRIVRPETGLQKTHYLFDEFGNFVKTF